MPALHFIEWTNALQTGIPVIDEQHKTLVGLINEANVRLSAGYDIKLLEQITGDLLAYALYHFETEEALLAQSGYTAEAPADAADHLQQHRAFSQQVVAMRSELRNGKTLPPATLLTFLYNWLVEHIENTDQRLAQFILAKES